MFLEWSFKSILGDDCVFFLESCKGPKMQMGEKKISEHKQLWMLEVEIYELFCYVVTLF